MPISEHILRAWQASKRVPQKESPRDEQQRGSKPAGVDPMSSTHRPEPEIPEGMAFGHEQAAAGDVVLPAADRDGGSDV